MTQSDLNDYSNWVGESPEDILYWVKQYGGWKVIFPRELPFFAHQVRNYFNQEPMTLTRYPQDFADHFLADIIKHNRATGGVLERAALTEYVYADDHRRLWYQMSSASTVYHFGASPPTWAKSKALRYAYNQSSTPVFKLMSLDGTGGSMETIIENPLDLPKLIRRIRDQKVGITQGPRSGNIGEVNIPESVYKRIVTAPWHQGSYNYSETAAVGFAAHERNDVEPDNLHPTALVNPPNRHLLLALRRFPKL